MNFDFSSGKWRIASLLVLVATVFIGLLTIRDYGMSWDETFRFKGGDKKLAYYEAFFAGEKRPVMTDNYPGLFDLPLAIFRKHFPNLGLPTEQSHVWSLCFGLLGLASTWRLVVLIAGERAGFWALVFLITMPRYYGHMFFNPKDIPFAATYMMALWALVRVLRQLPNFPTWPSVALFGIAAGFALSTRMAGLLLLFYFAAMIFGFLVLKYIQATKLRDELTFNLVAVDLVKWALRGGLSGLIAYLVLLIFWPTGHVNPFASFGGAVGDAQAYGWSGVVLMDGFFWEAQDLPVYYMLYWLLVATPEHLLLLIFVAACVSAAWCMSVYRQRVAPPPSLLWPRILILSAGLFPLLYMLVRQPVLYDGLRHFLFLLPVMAALSALAFEWLVRKVESSNTSRFVWLLQAAAMAVVAFTAYQMVLLHPYQYIYFNQASGGLPAAFNRDETDYWGISHKEAAEWMNANIGGDSGHDKVYKVYVGYTPWMLQAHLDKRFVVTNTLEGADYGVAFTRMNFDRELAQNSSPIHVVDRFSVPLCFVFKLDLNLVIE